MPRRFFQTDTETALAILSKHGPSAFAVFSILLAHMDRKTRTCRPSQPTICREANVSEATCKRAIHDLEASGFIGRAVGVGRGNETVYSLPQQEEKGSHGTLLEEEKGSERTPLDDKRVHDEPEKGSRQAVKGFTTGPSLTLYGQEKYGQEEWTRSAHAIPGLCSAALKFKTDYPETVHVTPDEVLGPLWLRVVRSTVDEVRVNRELTAWKESGQWDDPQFTPSMEAFLTKPKYRVLPRAPETFAVNGTKPKGGHTIQSMQEEIGRQLREQGIFTDG